MKVELTEDTDVIVSLLDHPDIINGVSNEECIDIVGEELKSLVKQNLSESLYFVVKDGDLPVGLVSFHDVAGDLEGHIAFLKLHRGRFAIEALNKIKEIIFKHTAYSSITAVFPTKRVNIKRILLLLGFKLKPTHNQNDTEMCHMFLNKEERSNA